MKIVADDRIPFLKGVFEPFANIIYIAGDRITNADLINTDALVTRSVTQCNAGLLEGSSVKLIATATIGDDHIDKEFCKKNKIEWVSAKGCNARAVVQYVTAALLSIAEKKNLDLKQLTIGIIGVGNIGSKIKNTAELLGIRVLLNDPPRAEKEGNENFAELDTLLESADVITLHVPLATGGKHPTYHLADEHFFLKFDKPVIFVNTSRGEVVDTTALKNAINRGSVDSSIIDVWESEPKVDLNLIKLADITTPHIAGYSLEGKATATLMVVNAISDFFGFGIKAWYPELSEIKSIIELNCTGLNYQEVLLKAVKQTYNIWEDDEKFRLSPLSFNDLRNNYKFRREFSAYKLKLTNCKTDIGEKLSKIGFNFVIR
ncbi:MAG: 4-phosphoerythronate dehydrogenase [Bacteroidales bacterium]|nr:4-phosphoerythronate dehydrogenase [Bacteroidales bacterium]